MSEQSEMKKTPILKRVLALIGVLILAGLYLTTFLLGVFGSAETTRFFMASVVLTVLIPVLFYGILLIAKVLSRLNHDTSGSDPSGESKEKS